MGYLEGKVLYGGISRCEFCDFSAPEEYWVRENPEKVWRKWYEGSIRIG